MIIWIDGTHGVGKSTVAETLRKRLGNQRVEYLDSDDLGKLGADVCRRVFLAGGSCLLQERPAFMDAFREKIDEIIINGYDFLIVAMALPHETYIEHLLDPLIERHRILHIILTASVETISERIKSDSGRDQKLALGRLQENIAFLEQNYPEAMRIDTERKSISEICDIILSKCTVQE